VAVPRLELPLRVTVLLREERRKSTALHAKALAPDSVSVYQDDAEIPTFDPDTTAVAFPSARAKTWAEMGDEDVRSTRSLVLLCCPWAQHHKLLELPQLAGVRHVRITDVPSASGFWRVPQCDEGQVSTIEALAQLLEEYECRTAGCGGATDGSAPSTTAAGAKADAKRPALLYFFDLIRRKIASVGAGGTLPWESAARAKRRSELEQPQRVRQRSVGRMRGYHEYGADEQGSARKERES
jgi:hypothetical protein